MKIKKQHQIAVYILIIILAVVSFGLVFYSQTKEVKVSKLNKEITDNNTQENSSIFTEGNKNTKTSEEIEAQKEKERILKVGEVIQLEDGWKRYVNKYYGYQYNFNDLDDLIFVGVGFYPKKNFIAEDDNFFSVSTRAGYKTNKQTMSLEEYLNTGGWRGSAPSHELVSLKKISRNVEMFEVRSTISKTDIRRDFDDYKEPLYMLDYWIDFKNPKFQVGVGSYSQYIWISCRNQELCKGVVDSFEFIE